MKCYLHNFIIEYFLFFTIIIIIALAMRKTTVVLLRPVCPFAVVPISYPESTVSSVSGWSSPGETLGEWKLSSQKSGITVHFRCHSCYTDSQSKKLDIYSIPLESCPETNLATTTADSGDRWLWVRDCRSASLAINLFLLHFKWRLARAFLNKIRKETPAHASQTFYFYVVWSSAFKSFKFSILIVHISFWKKLT